MDTRFACAGCEPAYACGVDPRPTRRVLALALVAATSGACKLPNPYFGLEPAEDGDPLITGSETAASEGTAGTEGSDTGAQSAAGSTSELTTGAVEDTEGSTTSTGEGSSGTGASGATSTGGAPLQVDAIAPEVAGCVLPKVLLLPHAGPQECAARLELISDYAGGMLVDTSFTGAGEGRPALVYLRFVFPPELAAATLIEAELALHVATFPDAGSDAAGVLRLAQPFEPDDLDSFAPGEAPGLEVALGPAAEGDEIVRSIPLDLIDLNAPLHLAVFPVSNDGGAFAGPEDADPSVRPELRIVYQP